MTATVKIGQQLYLSCSALDDMIQALRGLGFTVVGPRVVDGVISWQTLETAADLPRGVSDQQSAGSYRLVDGEPELMFQFVVGPDGPKRYFFPASLRLFEFHVSQQNFVLDAGPPQVPKLAMLGVRACELAAIAVQDRVFGIDDPTTFRCESEPYYSQTRQESLLIAVNCTRPSGTCFCAAWGTGPAATHGFDLALTELRDGFLVQVGSKRGCLLLEKLPVREPTQAEIELAEIKLERARERMGRALDVRGLKELLDQSIEYPEWDEIAHRCLSCGNCTMVCPTCFCCSVSDTTDLGAGSQQVSRTRQWESCFTHQFTYTVSGPERNTIRGRYRHWLRHKLGTWWEQFGSSGCVGCGRCITWCPVGIDLTEEVRRLRERSQAPGSRGPTLRPGEVDHGPVSR
ncbi:MAG: 4Fe-4S dicluster domain-containing protein [Pirellulaceae bacterium]|jgi:ferredoxin|nr:4Fe-4S dicluster domain-containing protein [Pirellulaceae bacterium]